MVFLKFFEDGVSRGSVEDYKEDPIFLELMYDAKIEWEKRGEKFTTEVGRKLKRKRDVYGL